MYEQDNDGRSEAAQPTLDDRLLELIKIVKVGANGGDVHPDKYDRAFQAIEAKCESMLSNCARRFDFLDGIDYDDLMQIARLGLLEAIRIYKPRNPYFYCFVQMIVRRVIGRTLKKDIRLWEQLEVTFHEEVQSAIDRAAYNRHIERFLTEKMVHDALDEAGCSELEREVMEHHLEGKNLGDIQDDVGRTYKSVEMARRRAMDKLEVVLRGHNWR